MVIKKGLTPHSAKPISKYPKNHLFHCQAIPVGIVGVIAIPAILFSTICASKACTVDRRGIGLYTGIKLDVLAVTYDCYTITNHVPATIGARIDWPISFKLLVIHEVIEARITDFFALITARLLTTDALLAAITHEAF
jgi:hypothetical protein